MGPNSRCFGAPRTSVTTIFGSILKCLTVVFFGHPYPTTPTVDFSTSIVKYIYSFEACKVVFFFSKTYSGKQGYCAAGNEGERKDWGRSHSSTRWALLPPALLFSCYATQPTTLLGWWRTVKFKIAPLLMIL